MRAWNHWGWIAVGCGIGLLWGCSSESGTDSPGTGANPGSGGTGQGSGSGAGAQSSGGSANDIVVGATGGQAEGGASGLGDGERNGGSIELTRDQVRAIEGGACTGVSAEVEAVPAVLQLVVDVSASMRDPAPGGAGDTKWDVTRRALLEAIDSIPSQVAVGLQLYPTMDANLGESNPGCVTEEGRVPIALLGGADSAQRAAFSDMLADVELLMGTPTHDAYTFALEGALGPYQGYGNKFMLVITDGAPTQVLGCGPLESDQAVETDPILATLADAASDGIRTFLIGSPGSEEGRAGDMRRWLSHGALIGGTALEGCSINGPDFCHFDMSQATNFSVALAEGLGAITAQVADGCTFPLPDDVEGQVIEPDSTTVIIQWGDGSARLMLNDVDADCSDGWRFSPAGEIVLCEQTCAQVNLDPLARVSVSLECSREQIDDVVR